jgi:putative transposase
MTYAFIEDRCGDLPTAFVCRTMKVSSSGFYEWRHHRSHPRQRIREDQLLTAKIREIHQLSRQTYGSPRVHAELRLGENVRCSRKRVERLMRQAQIVGLHKRRKFRTTRRDPDASPSDDLVNRQFTADAPNRLWLCDITEHPTGEGRVYLAAVTDAFSRRVIGWSIADHIRSELVVDALQMAIWRRYPNDVATVVHSDHGSQYTSWAFGKRLRAAGLLGSMGSVGDAFDNAAAESFFSIIQRELFDRQRWTTRAELANAIFEYIEAWFNPHRRHSHCNNRSPIDHEQQHSTVAAAA